MKINNNKIVLNKKLYLKDRANQDFYISKKLILSIIMKIEN